MMYYHILIDYFRLPTIFEIISLIAAGESQMDEGNQLTLIEYTLKSPKFLALFRGSLETEKYTFISNMCDLLDDDDLFLVCDDYNLK